MIPWEEELSLRSEYLLRDTHIYYYFSRIEIVAGLTWFW